MLTAQAIAEANDLNQVQMAAEDRHGHDREYRADVETAVAACADQAPRQSASWRDSTWADLQRQHPVGVTVRALAADLGQFGGAQHRARLRAQFAHPQLLRPLIGHVEVGPVPRIALGQAQRQPTGGLVAGSFIGLDVGKGLGQQGLITKALEPQPGQFPHGRPRMREAKFSTTTRTA